MRLQSGCEAGAAFSIVMRGLDPRIHQIKNLLERFRAKWIPVRVKKTRQAKNYETSKDSGPIRKIRVGPFAV
jgi:hypothetical protein